MKTLKNFLLLSALFLLVAFGFVVIFQKDHYRYQLSILAIFQNEERFLKEWLDFYRVLGVEHFYLFNNLSDDQYQKILQPYIEAGLVELIDWPFASVPGSERDWTRIQTEAYHHGLQLAEGQSKWVAMLDIDEFLFPSQKSDLRHFLKDYEDCSGLLVNWQTFGTSQVSKIPAGQLMIETLLLQSPTESKINTFCKSIVRPEMVKVCIDPHSVVYYPWTYGVDSDKRIFSWKFHNSKSVKIDKIRINHYWSRDEEFFHTHKLARYKNWGNKKQACIQRNEEANQVINKDILVWVPSIYHLQENDPLIASN